jgi:hypothetical protein
MRAGSATANTDSMNTNDATLTDVRTAQAGSRVEDHAPNAPARGTFDLVVQAVAGHAVGNSDTPYRLTLTAIDETTQQPVGTMSPGILAQSFAGPTWTLSGGAGPDFESTQVFTIPVPGGGANGPLAGHTLRYLAALVSQNGEIVSIAESRRFVLI